MKKTDNSVMWIGGYCLLPLLAVVLAALLLTRMLQRAARSSDSGLGRHEAAGEISSAGRK